MRPKDPYVCERCDEIEALLRDAANWTLKDDKLGAHLASYICVLILGVLEDCVEHLIRKRANKTGDSEITNYIVNIIDQRFRNPDWNSISGLLGEFSPEYKKMFIDRVSHDSPEAEALRDIVTSKNSLAHTGTSKLNFTVTDADAYYHRLLPVIIVLEEILG